MLADNSITKDKIGFDVIEPNAQGGIDITQIYDGKGKLWGTEYTSFKTTITNEVASVKDTAATVTNIVSDLELRVDSGEFKGDKGDKRETGASGKGVSSIVPQYYLSTSNTTLVGGSWGITPTWSSGKYIWKREHIIWSDGTTSDTTPVLDNTTKTITDTVSSVSSKVDAAALCGSYKHFIIFCSPFYI